MKEHLLKLQKRDISWSSYSSWTYSKTEWARRYLEDIYTAPNEKMVYGNVIGKKLGEDPTFLPDVPRYKVMEQKLKALVDGVKITGYLDSFCPETFAFYEYKTSSNDKKWTKESAKKHGQILFYMALIWKNYNIKPENIKCSLHYIPVEEYFEATTTKNDDIFSDENKPQVKMRLKEGQEILHFEISHTSMEVLKFLKEVVKAYREMEEFALAYKPESDIITNS